ncbi:RNA polymerase sigma factor [Candidatus Clostridium radicumherbarum]|uniref:RNA polymerase sigma factor n=1 Tax=Candidatus Clostridium radicumherbarum TaxID=3381662 RepID=A0ABW8TT94_9CLOT
MEKSDTELIELVLHSDIAAMEEIYKRYVDNCLKLAFLITKDWSSAEDSVQDAFIKAFSRINTFNNERSFFPWLTKIVVNEARKSLKKSRKYVELNEDISNKNSTEFIEDKVSEYEERALILKQIANLDLKYRLPIALKYYAELSEKEIANLLLVPTSTIKSRLYIARQKLKKVLIEMESDFLYER